MSKFLDSLFDDADEPFDDIFDDIFVDCLLDLIDLRSEMLVTIETLLLAHAGSLSRRERRRLRALRQQVERFLR